MMMSIDLALLLATSACDLKTGLQDIETMVFRYDHSVSMKGVFGEKPYPLIWLDLSQPGDLDRLEDGLTGRDSDGCNVMNIRNFCETFILQNPRYVQRPYISGNADPKFAQIPDDHPPRKESLIEYWTGLDKRRDAEIRAGRQPRSEDTSPPPSVFDDILTKLPTDPRHT
jgi:hypothetical protein